MAQAIERRDNATLNQLYTSALCLFALLSLLALVALSLLAIFPFLLGITGHNQQLAATALLLFTLKVVLDFTANAIHGIFSGQLRFDLDSQVSIAALLIKAGLMVALVEPYGVLALVVVTILADSFAHLTKFVLAHRIQPGLHLAWPIQFRRNCQDLFSYARHVVFIELARLIQEKSPLILISHLLGLVAISLYAIADRLLKQATMLVQTVTAVLQPYLIRKLEQGQLSVDLMKKNMQLHAWFTAIVLLPILLCGPAFILLWVGSEFALSQTLLLVMVFAGLLRTLSVPISQFLLAKADHALIAPLEMIAACVFVLLVTLLGHFYGLLGMVWGSVICSALVHTLAFAILAEKKLAIPIGYSLWLMFRLVMIFAGMLLFNHFFEVVSSTLSWAELIIWVVACILAAAMLGFCCLLDRSMRRLVWQMLFAGRRRFSSGG
ncbi:hypothetical protein QWY20_03105 [Alkalimonas sp. MEB108]|uniref:Polysaccharide biosynthesis protein n=1 Tax=Alkalimonas cellulosilytica TaxID=3058395 RepID=A0ABU7J1Q3_9GAMM|nr:hypothetical protein [Alkalimonas sp. MEB108]MEE2000430.1 hypothetical protein [Alkalimonas sp. MEB108]